MTLRTVPRYDPQAVTERGGRAVVVGASMAGLLAARVLSDAFEEVHVVEKDRLPDAPDSRRGVPQSRHIHVLHEAGRATLEDLFPGYGEDLIDAGGLVIDLARDLRFFDYGEFLAEGSARIPMYCASRPLFEYVARRRVAALDAVSVRDECSLTGYRFDRRKSAVTGALVRTADGREAEIPADVVVDATGRTSKTPDRLESHGYAAPPSDEVTIDVAYSTVRLDRPPDDRRAVIVMASPPRTRGGAVFPVENGEWILTVAGVHGDHPPTAPDGFREFAASLPVPQFRRLLDAHWDDGAEIVHYPFPSNRRRRYWELDRFPDGFLVVGDAIASFNPIYGQGMSVAALEALQLHHVLAGDAGDGLALRHFDRIERVVEDAWHLAVRADFRFPQTTGPEPTGTGPLNRYLSALTRTAHSDSEVAEAYLRVVSMERRPRSLLRPPVVWRVLTSSA